MMLPEWYVEDGVIVSAEDRTAMREARKRKVPYNTTKHSTVHKNNGVRKK